MELGHDLDIADIFVEHLVELELQEPGFLGQKSQVPEHVDCLDDFPHDLAREIEIRRLELEPLLGAQGWVVPVPAVDGVRPRHHGASPRFRLLEGAALLHHLLWNVGPENFREPGARENVGPTLEIIER